MRGKAIRWEKIDEDIHINSFFVTKEPQLDNEIAKLFHQLPYLDKCAVAEQIGIDVSLLKKFIYGIETPAPNMVKKIKNTLRALGEELLEIV